MAWFQLKLLVANDRSETISDFLLDAGAQSITFLDAESNPIFEPGPGETPMWDNLYIIALYDNSQIAQSHLDLLLQSALESAVVSKKIEALEDKDWEREWMDNFHPMQFGSRLWVCPSWQPIPDPSAANIMLDPGLAFGTGTHPTTALCLQWLSEHSINNKTVMDFGCGSGILAIGAKRLGAKHVIAVDNDPQAIEATQSNCVKNDLNQDDITCYLPEAYPQAPVDILLANILAEPLRQLAPLFAKLVKPEGDIVLSGILEEQVNELLDIYSQWFTMERPEIKQEWARLTGKRKASE